MYRQYEDPYKLEKELEDWLEQHPDKSTWDEYDYENYQNLKERINFAWQDDEYESDYMRENYPDEFYASENIDDKEPVESSSLLQTLVQLGKKILNQLTDTINENLDDNTIKKMLDSGKELELKTGDFDATIEILPAGDYPEESTKQGNYPYRLYAVEHAIAPDYVIFDFELKSTEDETKSVKDRGVKFAFDKESLDAEDMSVEDYRKLIDDAFEKFSAKEVEKLLEKIGVDGTVEDMQFIKSSTKLSFTLQKVVADDEIDLQLISINSPYEVNKTNEIITDIVGEPDFVSSLPEMTPASYEVCVGDDCYDVDPCDGFCPDMSDCIMKVLKPLYALYFDSMSLTWNAKGAEYPAIATLADTYMWTVRGMIDQLSIEHFAQFNYAPHPVYFMKDYNFYSAEDSAIKILQDDIYNIVSTIDLYYCNFEGVLQQCLIDMKDMFNTELNYTLARFDA